MSESTEARRARLGRDRQARYRLRKRLDRAKAVRNPTQLAKDQLKALEAFRLQVSNGEVECWLEEDWCDAFMRGYYTAKTERS